MDLFTQFNGLEYAALMLAFGISAIMPGIDFAMVLKQSITHGRAAAVVTSIGIGSAILVHGAYTILGIGLIISQSILLFNLLKFAGAAYLIFIGISVWRAPPPKEPDVPVEGVQRSITLRSAFVQGFLTNLLNPKAVLFFVALFTTLVSSKTPMAIKGFYVANMSLLLMAWFALVSVFFTIRDVRSAFFRFGKWFNRITGIAFISLAVSMVLTRQH